MFKESNRKPNKIWLDKGSEFYNSSMNVFIEYIYMYSTHNDGKSVVVERFFELQRTKFISI